ncbi:hypothetical protein K490DRAFT_61894 [Saccharata proteae CBS 121410]|uniref:RING-type domain-containing protein n=1 Tax=Saccharata proteae CBS 121410 TaxID=1314787 RepID=A0A9P4HWN0_9PEZI|nr:hypothetical protein K490DRAFT_61894 [Saccharata proteae CBS 121410]
MDTEDAIDHMANIRRAHYDLVRILRDLAHPHPVYMPVAEIRIYFARVNLVDAFSEAHRAYRATRNPDISQAVVLGFLQWQRFSYERYERIAAYYGLDMEANVVRNAGFYDVSEWNLREFTTVPNPLTIGPGDRDCPVCLERFNGTIDLEPATAPDSLRRSLRIAHNEALGRRRLADGTFETLNPEPPGRHALKLRCNHLICENCLCKLLQQPMTIETRNNCPVCRQPIDTVTEYSVLNKTYREVIEYLQSEHGNDQ